MEPNEAVLSELSPPEGQDNDTGQPGPPVALQKHVSARRQVTGVRLLPSKRRQIEQMLLAGEAKVFIARALGVSAHTVRAVAQQLSDESYTGASGGVVQSTDLPAVSNGEPIAPARTSLPDTLKAKAMQAVDHITTDKLVKASPQACAIVADRLLGRADALEKSGHDLNFMGQMAHAYGITGSHSVSRVTLEQRVTVETKHKAEDQ
jgi:hypothetical protein